MGIEKYFSIDRARAIITGNKESMIRYLQKYELGNYFDNIPDEEKKRRVGILERIVDGSVERYSNELDGLGRKIAGKGSMLLAILNDVDAYTSKVPLADISGFRYALFALKTVVELPALYRYWRKSGDWYGAITHLLLKPVRFLLPFVGPALESGAFERMVRRRVLLDAKTAFIKEVGEYVPFEERFSRALKVPVNRAVYTPEPEGAAA